MFRPYKNRNALLLQSAVLCVDCESISSAPGNECPVCGSHSLLSLARALGGTLLARKAHWLQESENGTLFDLNMTIALKGMKAKEVNYTLGGITRVLAPWLGQGWTSFHIDVEPVVNSCASYKAAA